MRNQYKFEWNHKGIENNPRQLGATGSTNDGTDLKLIVVQESYNYKINSTIRDRMSRFAKINSVF